MLPSSSSNLRPRIPLRCYGWQPCCPWRLRLFAGPALSLKIPQGLGQSLAESDRRSGSKWYLNPRRNCRGRREIQRSKSTRPRRRPPVHHRESWPMPARHHRDAKDSPPNCRLIDWVLRATEPAAFASSFVSPTPRRAKKIVVSKPIMPPATNGNSRRRSPGRWLLLVRRYPS
jgi:hypothetical protein